MDQVHTLCLTSNVGAECHQIGATHAQLQRAQISVTPFEFGSFSVGMIQCSDKNKKHVTMMPLSGELSVDLDDLMPLGRGCSSAFSSLLHVSRTQQVSFRAETLMELKHQ